MFINKNLCVSYIQFNINYKNTKNPSLFEHSIFPVLIFLLLKILALLKILKYKGIKYKLEISDKLNGNSRSTILLQKSGNIPLSAEVS